MAARKVLHKTATRRAKPKRSKKQIVEVLPGVDKIDGRSVTYQRELVKCGKPKCKKWHGPYWYAYWTWGKRTRTLYIGKVRRSAHSVRLERDRRKLERVDKHREQLAKEWEARQAKPQRKRR
jgi:hypothetical protein